MSNILITGGAGFIGSHLVHSLGLLGHNVRIFDNLRRSDASKVAGHELIVGDIRNPKSLTQAMRDCDIVIHAAAQSNVMGSESDVEYCLSTNVAGTQNVVDACCLNGVKHLVFFSSREVYGQQDSLPVSESAKTAPHNQYGQSKLAGEKIILQSGLPFTILRLANVFGLGDSGRVLPLWVHSVQTGAPITVYGGQQILDFVSVDTVCEAIHQLMKLGPQNRQINIGAGQGVRLIDIAHYLIDKYGCTINIEPSRSVEVQSYVSDITLMSQLLKLSPQGFTFQHFDELVNQHEVFA